MRDTPEFAEEKLEACKDLYSTNQRELLKCYDLIGYEYTVHDQVKVCTEDYHYLSQIDKLYECMRGYGVRKNEEYCNLNPSYTHFIDFDEIQDHMFFQNLETFAIDPFFNCLVDHTEATESDARYCVEAINVFKLQVQFELVDDPSIDFEKMRKCFTDKDMPPKGIQEEICKLRFLETQPKGFQSTGQYCEDREDELCWDYIYEVFSDYDCNDIYYYEYEFLFQGEKRFLDDFGVQCKKYITNYTDYNACIAEKNDTDHLLIMNA
jgi:hypothetical protein